MESEKMSKTKKHQHYVPRMYYSNFYANENNEKTHSVSGCLTCYRANSKTIFNGKANSIASKKFLYEYDTKNKTNEIENRFDDNVETPLAPILRQIIKKCYMGCGKVLLTNDELSTIHKFMAIQLFRMPEVFPSMTLLIKKLIFEQKNIEVPDTEEVNSALTGLFLQNISEPNSDFIKNGENMFFENYYTVFLKAKDFHFFTSECPVMLTTIDETLIDKTFVDYDIHMPLNKDFCVVLFPKKTTREIENGIIIEIDSDAVDDLILALLSASDIVVSDGISNEMIKKIDEIYPRALENRNKVIKQQKIAKKNLL